MIASGFRALGPFMAGSLWSWSLTNGQPFPLNHFFVFIIAACICFFGFFVAFFIPKSLNYPKIDWDNVIKFPDEEHSSIQSYQSFQSYKSISGPVDISASQSFNSLSRTPGSYGSYGLLSH